MRKKSGATPADTHKLAAVERDSALSELAAMVAHELNQPLAIITNYIHGCIRRLESNNFKIDEVIHAMKQMVEQSNRANDIILRMKNYCSNKTLCFQTVCLHALIQETIILIKNEIMDPSVEIIFHQSIYKLSVPLDKHHIQQVILNILRHSIDAMHHANTLYPTLIIETHLRKNHAAEVTIRNNAPPIPKENLHWLFNSYLPPQLNDISLAASHRMIESHGGQFSVTQDAMGGNRFTFSLSLKIVS